MSEKTTSFEELLDTHGFIVYTNVGYSMMPLIRQRRDIIEIRKKEGGRYNKYDVVLYKRNGRYILHRILKVRPEDYVLAGDHNYFLEYGIRDEEILGIMTRVIRDGKPVEPDNSWYRIYVHLWCDFYPIRMMILRIKAIIRTAYRRSKEAAIRLIKRLLRYE